MVDSLAPFDGETTTVHAALQVSGTGWILAVGDPAAASGGGPSVAFPEWTLVGAPGSRSS